MLVRSDRVEAARHLEARLALVVQNADESFGGDGELDVHELEALRFEWRHADDRELERVVDEPAGNNSCETPKNLYRKTNRGKLDTSGSVSAL